MPISGDLDPEVEARRIRDQLEIWLRDSDDERSARAMVQTRRDLPPESELMKLYDARRATVRRALELMAQNGVIERRTRTGTRSFTTPPVLHIAPYLEGFGVTGPIPSVEVAHELLSWQVRPTPPPLLTRLDVSDTDSHCLHAEVRLHIHGHPISVGTHYVRAPEHVSLEPSRLHANWYRFLVEAGLEVAAADMSLRAVTADAEDARLLEVDPGAAMLTADGVISDRGGARIAFYHSRAALSYRIGHAPQTG